MGRLSNKVAIVTGASRDIGAEYARAIVGEGGKVVAGVRDLDAPVSSSSARTSGMTDVSSNCA